MAKKNKAAGAFAIAVVLLVSFFAFTPGQSWSPVNWFSGGKSPGLLESAQTINSTVWRAIAANAWAYFQPGVGVDSKTGLPYAGGTDFKGFTDWDLGVYIQSVIDAQKIGLISTDGAWGSNQRLEKIVSFLETRPLNASTSYPFWFYDSTNGQDYHALSDKALYAVDGADTGRLFVALNNLKNFEPSLASRINYVVYNRTDYNPLVDSISGSYSSSDIYAYYIYSGYAEFWPSQIGNAPNEILNGISNKTTVSTYGINLPNVPITCEPLLCAIFEVNSTDARLTSLMKQVYLAHEAYYNATWAVCGF